MLLFTASQMISGAEWNRCRASWDLVTNSIKYQKESRTMATRNEFDSVAVKRVNGQGKARQETINARIKIFRLMEERFRHVRDNQMECHRLALKVACVLVQYEIEGNHPLFDV
jgi:hypothetical protein